MILVSLHIPHTSESGLCSLLTGLYFHATVWEAVISITAQKSMVRVISGVLLTDFSLDHRVLSRFCVG